MELEVKPVSMLSYQLGDLSARVCKSYSGSWEVQLASQTNWIHLTSAQARQLAAVLPELATALDKILNPALGEC